ncbi:SHOCT domain-containing protein [Levilinea saccharolytica]|uniref:SHOCT domain-containing protein n=1 Tax=Levilinea saccharolytica TaxID=229921 RepID=A0A0P6YF64_9CHLR|nr:SHOCT domain-containing protein [Levilinea saccharolytica]KPL90814.1 hypothetical protein ADN01_01785 [Levilinea saccharolytica]GAP18911.1 protein containing short C-terminal domain [Levilinea saccharolytica]HOR84224.1 SHOCT domain-containing protein [Anaerolineaceae bacterium]HQJ32451.1 SHOCT domain-containing protein [Anaerolineaceae bacterium]
MMMGYWLGGLGWVGMIINMIISIAMIIGVVFLVVWIVKRLGNNESGQQINNSTPSVIEIVKQRYAKGEITREEFQKFMVDLGTR